MKGQAELNALLLLAKNYHRLDKISVEVTDETIEVDGVPEPLVDYFKNRIKGIITEEKLKALELIEQATKAYAAAMK